MKSAPKPPADPARGNNSKTPAAPAEKSISTLAPSQYEALIQLIKEFTGVLETEIQLLGKRDIKSIAELLPRKLRLLSTYQANMKVISANPEVLKSAPVETRAMLKSVSQKLDATATKNAKLLKGALMATKRIVSNVMGSIREETLAKTPSYANTRNPRLARNKYSPTCPAVAIRTSA